jgi:hypothetical protein
VELTGVLQMLDELGPSTDIRPALALVAGRNLVIDAAQLQPALRRSMLLLASGGDPHRELALDGRAVTALAAELDFPERRAEISRGLDALRAEATGLAGVSPALEELLLDASLAWRAYACALLADELE